MAGSTRRPPGIQAGVDADDFSDRPFPRVLVRPFGESESETVAEVVLQGGVIGLGCGDGRLEQDAAVDAEPASVEGLHLVSDGHMGVQVGVAGAAVAVGERGRDQPLHVHLPYAVGAGAAKQGVLFDEAQRVGDGGPVGLFDLRRNRRFGERPQRRDALHRGEGEVVAGDRGRLWAGVFSDRGGQFPGILRRPAVLGGEELARHLGTYPGPFAAWNRPVAGQACRRIEFGDPLGNLNPKRGDVVARKS